MHQITIAPANGPMKKPTVPASPFLTTARKRKRPPRQKRSGAFPALVWGQVVRFFFTPQDTTCDWGNNGLFRPEGIQSTPLGRIKAMFWATVAVAIPLVIAAL